jgi:signal transduction histidine kinase
MQVGRGPFTALADGRVELADLASGEHAVRLQASLDGSLWSDPLTVRIRVATPWWRRPWVLGVALLAGVGLVVLVSRARLAWLLARERERLRIAMDLHDELGSGLGSIRLLATVLRRDRVGDAERVDLARRIERSTGELHGSLSEMVGSLRPGGATGRALVDRLWRRGRDLVVGGGVDLRVVLGAGLESTALPLVVCRDLERIGVEALHNAARHGGAQSVTIGLARAGAQWRLWVRDDGVGFDTSGSSSGGLGLESMRRRAERIGGRLEVTSAPGQGTTVTVHFDPRTHRRGNA